MSLENPQLKDGFTSVANTIMEPICHTRLSGTDWDLLHFLWRKTYGWSKPSDAISLSQFCEGTGLSQAHVCRTIKRLLAMNVIFRHVARIGNSETATYEFNKRVWAWKSLPKMATVAKVGKKPLPKMATIEQEHITATGLPATTLPELATTLLPELAIKPLPALAHTTSIKDTTSKKIKRFVIANKIDDDPVVALYRRICVPAGLPNILALTPSRVRNIKRAVSDYGLLRLEVLFRKVAMSDFLLGRSPSKTHVGWKADFDFLLKADTLVYINEGSRYFDEPLIQSGPLEPMLIWTEEQDRQHKEQARKWLDDDGAKEEER